MAVVQDSDLAFLSQKAQGGLLEILEDEGGDPRAHGAALDAAVRVLEHIAEATTRPKISEESVPDSQVRELLERRLFAQHPGGNFPDDVAVVFTKVRGFISAMQKTGARPEDTVLVECLEFFRNAIARPVLVQRLKASELGLGES